MELHHHKELKAIDQLLTKILVTADLQCTPNNPAPWSPDLNQAYLCHQLWSIALTAKQTKRDLTAAITAICQCLVPTPDDMESANCSISANLCQAQKVLRKAKRDANNYGKSIWKLY